MLRSRDQQGPSSGLGCSSLIKNVMRQKHRRLRLLIKNLADCTGIDATSMSQADGTAATCVIVTGFPLLPTFLSSVTWGGTRVARLFFNEMNTRVCCVHVTRNTCGVCWRPVICLFCTSPCVSPVLSSLHYNFVPSPAFSAGASLMLHGFFGLQTQIMPVSWSHTAPL